MSSTTREFLGHPIGLSYLFFTEMWERFSFYGMRALLVLYMIQHLLDPQKGLSQHVIGYSALAGLLQMLFGELKVQGISSQIYGLYTGFVYFTPFIGGLLADRVLG
ncbi:MAG: MFS transporter, partial [Ignavibacteria bacterium]